MSIETTAKDRAIPPAPESSGAAPHLALVAVQIMFGTWPVFGKIVLRSMPPTGLVALRISGAALALLLLQRKLSQLWRMPRRDFAWLTLCSLLGVVINQLLFVKGLSLTTAINATLLGTTIPVFTLLVSIAFGYDSVSLRRILGIALAAGGVIYLVNPLHASFSLKTSVGDLLIVANSFCYGTYIAISRGLFKRYGALNVITWIFLIGAVFTLPLAFFSFQGVALQAVSYTTWLTLLYIILIPTVACYYLNAWALTKVTPNIVAVYIYLQPLIAFGLSPVILGEQWSSRTIVASILIFAGVGIVTKRARSRAVREVAEHPEALAH